MSDRRGSTFVGFWLFAFIVGKLVPLGGLAFWSWWWLFLPAIPIVVESIKALLR